jgi:hypothetical protein
VKTSISKQIISLVFSLSLAVPAVCQDLGSGFFDHGVASPISSPRGVVATVDGGGRNAVLVWLFDHRGGYALLMIDAETGKSQQFTTPFSLDVPYGDVPYASILSAKNKYYTLFNSHFAEFDPVKRSFTFSRETTPKMAMGMTEDDRGVIWAVTYPNSGLVSFDPKTKQLKDYGSLYKQNWLQYPRYLATDKAGWVYFALGNTASQIIAVEPASGKATPLLDESARRRGSAYVYRDVDGNVYGQRLQDKTEDWYKFYKGTKRNIGKNHSSDPKPIIAGSQGLFHRTFPDGKKISELDLLKRELVVSDPKTHAEKKVSFEYTTDGAIVMGVGTSPQGTIAGGTTFPMRFFNYHPQTKQLENLEAVGQFNAVAKQGDRFYFGVYPQGALLEWNPAQAWTNTKKGEPTNPLYLATANPVIHRPSRVLAYPDGKTLIMSGTPEYGYTGGGLLFWDREQKKETVIPDSAIILDQSTLSMVPLPAGKLLGGTTTAPGTGGEKKATAAELYIMDISSKKIDWHEVVFPGVQNYSDLCIGPRGLIYGIADSKNFFVFDPLKRSVVYQQNLQPELGRTTSAQSPRIFITGANNEIYLLVEKGIARVDPGSFKVTMVAKSPVPINAGGDYLDGRIYFVSGSHLCSYQL